LNSEDIKKNTKSNGWQFNWKNEFKKPENEIYKLTINNNPNIIQGLVSLEVKSDHVFMHLIESAPFNIGRNKTYLGVPGNLVAFAFKLSFQRGHEGFVFVYCKNTINRTSQKIIRSYQFWWTINDC